MKTQNQNQDQVPASDRTLTTVIPKVRYHPSIQTPTPAPAPRLRSPAGRPPQVNPVDMKTQNQNQDQVPASDRTLTTVIPKVRYHPSIQTPTPAPAPRLRSPAGRPPQVNPGPGAGRPPQENPGPGAGRPPQVNPGPGAGRPPQENPGPGAGRPPQENPGPGAGRPPQVNPGPGAGRPPQENPGPGAGRPPQVNPGPGAGRPPQENPGPGAGRPLQVNPGPGAGHPPQVNPGPAPEQIPVSLGVQLDPGFVEDVEVLTRGQSTNQDWFSWRRNRITASVAHRIAHCRFINGKSKTPPPSYLSAVTGEGPRVQTRAMSWGVQMEAEAVRSYQQMKSAALGRPVSVQACGLFIDARRPWLAASPDGMVTDSVSGRRLLCLEVKCPYKHRDRRVEDACRDDRTFCLELRDQDGREPGGSPVYRLKTSHSYYTQIQVQLAVTGLRRADLAVFTRRETAIVPVTFDPELWEETLSKLERFYTDAVLPHLRDTTRRDTAAARAPEL